MAIKHFLYADDAPAILAALNLFGTELREGLNDDSTGDTAEQVGAPREEPMFEVELWPRSGLGVLGTATFNDPLWWQAWLRVPDVQEFAPLAEKPPQMTVREFNLRGLWWAATTNTRGLKMRVLAGE